MKSRIRIRGGPAATFAALLLVFILAAQYLGGAFVWVFWSLFFFLTFSLVQLLVTYHSLRFDQTFSTKQPAKGDAINFKVRVRVGTRLPSSRATMRFIGVREDLAYDADAVDFFPDSRAPMERSWTVSCRFRGIYAVGVESLELHDISGMITYSLPVHRETFFVYPRMVELRGCRLSPEGSETLAAAAGDGSITDPTMFRGLEEYRAGQSIRRLAWRKFASWGVPLVLTFDRSAMPGLVIYLDTRSEGSRDDASLEAEDCAIEAMVGMARYFADRGIPVTARFEGRRHLLTGDCRDFGAFFDDTVRIGFAADPTRSALHELQADIQSGQPIPGGAVGVFRSLDAQLIDFLDEIPQASVRTQVVVVTRAMPSAEVERLHAFAARVNESMTRLVLVRNEFTIQEDLR